MKAQLLNDFGGADQFAVADVPPPKAGAGQVRVRVRAIGINPVDVRIRTGSLQDEMSTQLPAILGSDVAGEVDEVGDGVDDLSVGDRVVGLALDGAYAEYAIARADVVVPIPDGLDFERAATIPTAGEAAHRVIGILDPKRGETVLVNGAAGSVGSAAVQLLVRDGVKVIGTAGEDNHDYVRGLGAEPTTYGDGIVDRIRALAPEGVDAVFDVTDHGFVKAAIELRGGTERIVTISEFAAAVRASPSPTATRRRSPTRTSGESSSWPPPGSSPPRSRACSPSRRSRPPISSANAAMYAARSSSGGCDERRAQRVALGRRRSGSEAGRPGYAESTSPLNATADQRPDVVVVAEQAQDVAAAVRHARAKAPAWRCRPPATEPPERWTRRRS